MIDLEAVRARLRLATNTELNLPDTSLETHARWKSWEQDVPGLLELIEHMQRDIDHEREKAKKLKDAVRIVIVAARNWVYSDVRDGGSFALIQAVDMMPWTVLDDLGIDNGKEE